MARKPEIKLPEPVDTLKPNREPLNVGGAGKKQLAQEAQAPAKAKPAPTKKVRKPTTVHLPLDLLEEAKGFVMTTYGVPGSYKTFANFMEAALKAEVERAREKYNNGEPLPREQQNVELRTGRPMGS